MPDDVINLREYVDTRFAELERRITMMVDAGLARADAARREMDKRDLHAGELMSAHADAHAREHALQDEARKKASEDIDRRLESMNEFRDQLRDQAATFVPRDLVDEKFATVIARFDTLAERNASRISALERGYANLQGRMVATMAAIGIVFAILGLALRFL